MLRLKSEMNRQSKRDARGTALRYYLLPPGRQKFQTHPVEL